MFTELLELFIPVLVAALAGGLVGIEREYRDKSAGFRTMILIAVGASLFTIMSLEIGGGDRMAAAVVTGVGFLGAGVVLKDGFNIQGLTTAASIWMVASLGVASGAGYYELVGAVSTLVLLVLWVLPPFERFIDRLFEFVEFDITIKNSDAEEDEILDIFEECKIKIVHIRRTRMVKGERTVHIKARLTPAKRRELSEILVNEKGVLAFSA